MCLLVNNTAFFKCIKRSDSLSYVVLGMIDSFLAVTIFVGHSVALSASFFGRKVFLDFHQNLNIKESRLKLHLNEKYSFLLSFNNELLMAESIHLTLLVNLKMRTDSHKGQYLILICTILILYP